MGIRTLVAAGERNRGRVVGLLESAGGYTVVAQARDGVTAVQLAERHQPDLVVIEAARGMVRMGDQAYDLGSGPLPPRSALGAVLDPPVLQSGLVCGENIRLG